MEKKNYYVISNTRKSIAFEILAKGLKQYNIVYILLQNEESEFSNFLKQNHIQYKILKIDLLIDKVFSFFYLLIIFFFNRPCFVHTHLREANYVGLLASWLVGIKNRIYTRHHSTYNFVLYPKEVKWDKLCNRLATKVVSISKNVSKTLILREEMDKNKVVEIPHGFNLKKYRSYSSNLENVIKGKYNLNHEAYPIVGAISRSIIQKGLIDIIEAFSLLKRDYPSAHLILANTGGKDYFEINSVLNKLLKPKDFTLIKFESNVYALYKEFDLFVHVPIDKEFEAFGQVYVESIAAGIPSIFSLSGIANEFVENEVNAMVVNYNSPNEIVDAMLKILNNEPLKNHLSNVDLCSLERFSADNYIKNHINLYSSLCQRRDKK